MVSDNGAALAAGVDPASAEGQVILDELLAGWAVAARTADSTEFRFSHSMSGSATVGVTPDWPL
jgi:hypothetical protein